MTADRPYSAARTPDAAIAELRRCAGSQLDPSAVAALLAVLGQRQFSGGCGVDAGAPLAPRQAAA